MLEKRGPFEGAEVLPDAIDWIHASPENAKRAKEEAEKVLDADASHKRALDRRTPMPVTQISEDRPHVLLRAHELGGALLTAGEVLVVAGDGGVGKTTLLASLLLGIASHDLETPAPLPGGIFHGVGGPVLYAAHEDRETVIASLVRSAAQHGGPWQPETDLQASMNRFHVLPMRARALYGIEEARSFNQRPAALDGWYDLWYAVDATKAKVVVIDPALSAFVSDQTHVAAVRLFLDDLRREAEGREACGVILAAHSNKQARQQTEPFDVGQVSGSTAWVDQPRGVLTLTRTPESQDGRTLGILKSNYGPARRLMDLQPQTHPGTGDFVGFEAMDQWEEESAWRSKHIAQPARCAGLTRKGDRCNSLALEHSDFCSTHQHQDSKNGMSEAEKTGLIWD